MFVLVFCSGFACGALCVWLWSLTWIEPEPEERRPAKLFAVGRTWEDLERELCSRN